MDLRFVDSARLIRQMEALRQADATLAFDADGTLWSGDVGEDGFLRAVSEGLIRDEALPALLDIAARFAVPAVGSANDVARSLWIAYTEQRFPEREICEVMTWCYAGWHAADFAAFCSAVVQDAALQTRLHRELAPIIDWARRFALQLLVVSASPRGLVEAGARSWGFSEDEVIAATPSRSPGGYIDSSLVGPVPYGRSKCDLAWARMGQRQWLASFGDNVFDVDMLCAAHIGVAVRPKPALRARLAALPQLVVLSA